MRGHDLCLEKTCQWELRIEMQGGRTKKVRDDSRAKRDISPKNDVDGYILSIVSMHVQRTHERVSHYIKHM